MSTSVAVAGATGYAGQEILRLLLAHPATTAGELTIGALCAHSQAGRRLGDISPHLSQLSDGTLSETSLDALEGHDVVFLALPHGHSAAIGSALQDEVTVIDCAADFRLKSSSDWDEFYGGTHAGHWPYGIPELPGHRETLRGAKRIAVPGCFPTAVTLGALPAVAEGLVEPELSAIAVTGVSGAGKKASVALLGAETMGNLRAYSPGGSHRHTPEIVQNLSEVTDRDVHVTFTPVLAPLTRGILATITAPLTTGVDQAAVTRAYKDFYASEPFCLILEPGQQPETHNVVGSNMAHIQAHVDARAGRLVMTAAIDNLTKGTAGAAVQCMNLALGWPEGSGLPVAGVAP